MAPVTLLSLPVEVRFRILRWFMISHLDFSSREGPYWRGNEALPQSVSAIFLVNKALFQEVQDVFYSLFTICVKQSILATLKARPLVGSAIKRAKLSLRLRTTDSLVAQDLVQDAFGIGLLTSAMPNLIHLEISVSFIQADTKPLYEDKDIVVDGLLRNLALVLGGRTRLPLITLKQQLPSDSRLLLQVPMTGVVRQAKAFYFKRKLQTLFFNHECHPLDRDQIKDWFSQVSYVRFCHEDLKESRLHVALKEVVTLLARSSNKEYRKMHLKAVRLCSSWEKAWVLGRDLDYKSKVEMVEESWHFADMVFNECNSCMRNELWRLKYI